MRQVPCSSVSTCRSSFWSPAWPPARVCDARQWGGAGVRLPADGDGLLHLFLSALDRTAAHGRCLEQPRLVRLRQAAAQLVSLLLDLPGLALVAGCLVLGLGLAAGGPPWLTAGERVVIGLVLAVVALTMAGYVAALAIGVTVGLVLLLALAGIAAGGWLLWHHRGRYDLPAFPRRSGAPLAVAALALGM